MDLNTETLTEEELKSVGLQKIKGEDPSVVAQANRYLDELSEIAKSDPNFNKEKQLAVLERAQKTGTTIRTAYEGLYAPITADNLFDKLVEKIDAEAPQGLVEENKEETKTLTPEEEKVEAERGENHRVSAINTPRLTRDPRDGSDELTERFEAHFNTEETVEEANE